MAIQMDQRRNFSGARLSRLPRCWRRRRSQAAASGSSRRLPDRGLRARPREAFPARLERRCATQGSSAVIDAGVSGDTSAGGLARLDWVIGDPPSHVIVELGGNDGLRALPPEAMGPTSTRSSAG